MKRTNNAKRMHIFLLSVLIGLTFINKTAQAQVIEQPPGSGRLYRYAVLGEDTWGNPLLDVMPAEDSDGLLRAFRGAFDIRITNSALGLSLLQSNNGACGESSDRLVEQMRLVLPSTWTARQIRSVVGSELGGSVHQTTLLTSPSGNFYAIDVSMGYVQIVRMLPAHLPNGDGWVYSPGEENYFSPYIANALAGQLIGNRSWIPSVDRSPRRGLCKVPAAEKKLRIEPKNALDPNGKLGSTGAGLPQYISGQEPLRYSIFFENLQTATLPAQDVVVTDQLDATEVDLNSLSLGPVAFGNNIINPSAGLSSYTADVDLRPANNLIVRVNAELDKNTGLLTWRFTSIDPATGQPTTDPLAGFLPPDKNPPEGQGSVVFTVMPKPNLSTGTEIRNKARIVFDNNAPIDTPEWLNTIDNSMPTTRADALNASQPFVIFKVTWGGTDTGSGVRDYTVYFSENGGPYTIWLNQTTETSAYFIGQPSKNYAFYTIATDKANNQETVKTSSEAGTSTRTDITNANDDSRYFVWEHYGDFLGRQPDDSGFDFWTNQIESCGTDVGCREVKRINVSASFFLSIEFQQTGYLVERIYKSAYGNATGTSTLGGTHQLSVPVIRRSEFLTDTQEISQGVVVLQPGWEQKLESNKLAFALGFVQRARFVTAFPTTLTPTQFVDQLFTNAGVTPSSADRSAAINEFGSAADTSDAAARAGALRRVAENPTLAQQELNRAFVLMEYFGYLRRDPNSGQDTDYTGYDFWLTKLNQFNGDYIKAEMVKAFITSSEYRQRFGP